MSEILVWGMDGIIFFSVALQPSSAPGRHFVEVSRSQKFDTNTPSRTPLNAWSAHCRSRYVHNKQGTQQTNIHTLSWIRTRDSSNQATANLSLRPRGHEDQLHGMILTGEGEVFEKKLQCDFAQQKSLMDGSGLETWPPPRQAGEEPLLRLYCESVIGIHWELARRLVGIREEATVLNFGICLLRLKRRNASRYTGGVWRDTTSRHCVPYFVNLLKA